MTLLIPFSLILRYIMIIQIVASLIGLIFYGGLENPHLSGNLGLGQESVETQTWSYGLTDPI